MQIVSAHVPVNESTQNEHFILNTTFQCDLSIRVCGIPQHSNKNILLRSRSGGFLS